MASPTGSLDASRGTNRDSKTSPERRSLVVTFNPVATKDVELHLKDIEYSTIITMLDDGKCNDLTDDRDRCLPSAQAEQAALSMIERSEQALEAQRSEAESAAAPGPASGTQPPAKLSVEDLTISALERYDALRALNDVDPNVLAMFCEPVGSAQQRAEMLTFDSTAEQFNLRLSRPVSWKVFRRFQYRVHILNRTINRLTSDDPMMIRLKNNSTGFYVGIYFKSCLVVRIEMQNLISISRKHNVATLTVRSMICIQQRLGEGETALALGLRDVETARQFMADMERARSWLGED